MFKGKLKHHFSQYTRNNNYYELYFCLSQNRFVNDNANINIPIENGVFSIQPSMITSVDSHLISRIDSTTMDQLRQLQTNLNIIMSEASRK